MCAMLKDHGSTVEALNTDWIKTPYGLRLMQDPSTVFKTLLEQEAFVMGAEVDTNSRNSYDFKNSGLSEDTEHGIKQWMEILESAAQGNGKDNRDEITTGASSNEAAGDLFYSHPNYTDTRVGGNDAINPYWQFNMDDDIVPPILEIHEKGEYGNTLGMGRVYSETYDSNQQILWLSMGVPEYTNLISFYMDAGDSQAASAMNRGTLKGLIGTIITYTFKAAVWAFTFPVMAPFYVAKWFSRLFSDRITAYYYFKPAMVIYYEMVNTMLSYLAVAMGLYPQILVRRRDSTKVLDGQYPQMQFGNDHEQIENKSADDVDNDAKRNQRRQRLKQYDRNKLSGLQTEAGNDEIQVVDQPDADRRSADGTILTPEEAAQREADRATENEQQQINLKQSNTQMNAYDPVDVKDPDGSNANNGKNAFDANTLTDHVENWKDDGKNSFVDGGSEPTTDEERAEQDIVNQVGNKVESGDSGIPALLKYGPDIFSILNRRKRLFDQARVSVTTRMLMKAMMEKEQDVGDSHDWFSNPQDMYIRDDHNNVGPAVSGDIKEGAWEKCWSALKASMFGAGDYIGFKIERGVSVSESITNGTTQLGIASKLNEYASSQRERYQNFGGSWLAKTIDTLVEKGTESFINTLAVEVLSKAASAIGLGDIGAILTNGNGFIDMPNVWNSSQFARNFSFNINLRARYGDPVSIYQSVYIPMCMLLCAGMPRAVGNAMYTSPFLIKAFCKGMFSIPCGLITSMTFTRGDAEYGWSNTMLPTRVDVQLTIEDMSPTFFLAMQDIGLFDTFTRNDKMMEYLDTLSALGISERIFAWPKAMRKLTAALLIKRNTIFNSNYWGMRLGKTNMARAIAAVLPFGNHEKSDVEYNRNNK